MKRHNNHNWNRQLVDEAKLMIATECAEQDGRSVNAGTHAFSMLRRLCRLKDCRIHGRLSDIARRHRMTERQVQNLAEHVLVDYWLTKDLKVPYQFDRKQYREQKSARPSNRKLDDAALRARLKDAREIERLTGCRVHVDEDLQIQIGSAYRGAVASPVGPKS